MEDLKPLFKMQDGVVSKDETPEQSKVKVGDVVLLNTNPFIKYVVLTEDDNEVNVYSLIPEGTYPLQKIPKNHFSMIKKTGKHIDIQSILEQIEIANMFIKAFDESKTMELMQGDLISRSRVIENIWDVFNSYANDSQRFDEYETKAINNAFKVLQKQIENQPTVYDLEKVVQSVRETIYQMGLDESQAEIIVADIRNGGKE